MSEIRLAIWSMRAAVAVRPAAPLMAIDRPKLAVRVRPFVPDADAVLLQPAHIGVAAQEPQQLVDDRLGEQLLGGDQRKPVRQIEAHLVTEHRKRAGAGAVALLHAGVQHALHQVQILAHGWKYRRFCTLKDASVGRACELFSAGDKIIVERVQLGIREMAEADARRCRHHWQLPVAGRFPGPHELHEVGPLVRGDSVRLGGETGPAWPSSEVPWHSPQADIASWRARK